MPKLISRQYAKSAGLKRYFTDEPCLHGHICERYVNGCASKGACVECAKVGQATFAIKNPQYQSDKWKVYRNHLPSLYSEHVRVFYLELARKELASKKAAQKKWRDENHEHHKAATRNKVARRLGIKGTHSGADVIDIYYLQKGQCAYCRESLGHDYHVDHTIPTNLGGLNDRKNLQLCCPSCNQKKGSIHPLDFARKQGMLL